MKTQILSEPQRNNSLADKWRDSSWPPGLITPESRPGWQGMLFPWTSQWLCVLRNLNRCWAGIQSVSWWESKKRGWSWFWWEQTNGTKSLAAATRGNRRDLDSFTLPFELYFEQIQNLSQGRRQQFNKKTGGKEGAVACYSTQKR